MPTGDYDEIYQWETDIYKDAQAKVLPLQQNSGYKYRAADRGYMELSLYKERPKRMKLGDTFRDIKYIKGNVNGIKTVTVEGTREGINSERKFYTVEFQDIDGEGTNAYLTADNVDSDYFVAIVEVLAGRKHPIPDVIGGAQEGDADSEAQFALVEEEIAFRNAAEKMVYKEKKDELQKYKEEGFSIIAEYYKTPKDQNGKEYNIYCEYFVKGAGAERWYMFLEEKDGVFTQAGEPAVEKV